MAEPRTFNPKGPGQYRLGVRWFDYGIIEPMGYKVKESQREYQKEWARRRRVTNREFIQNIKIERGCADCGYNDHHAGLEFDHVGEKTLNVASMMGHTQEKILKEISQCEVVCGTCHNIRTWNRMR